MDTTKVTATKNKEKKNSDTLQGSKSKADRNKAAMEIYMHPPAHLIKQANENAKSKEKTKISK
ncbi:MAG TPA: hypothetical protein VNX68_01350 [Nitrosopumilaceae archaeon]|nr:hypothetical protein [Nitrosopumilaceae archaeon]